MDIYDCETNRLIVIKPPVGAIKRYLKIIGKSDINQIDSKNIRSIFSECVKDYKNGKISLDNLSVISNELLSCVPQNERGLELGDILETAADLAYYERTLAGENSKAEEFKARLSGVLNFKI